MSAFTSDRISSPFPPAVLPRPRLLCVGHLIHDLKDLIVVAERAAQCLGLEPVFLVTSPAVMREPAEAFLQSQGQMFLSLPTETYHGMNLRNPLRRSLTHRAANRALARQLLQEIRPAAILSVSDAAYNSFLAEATRAGVPTVLMQFAFWGDRTFYKGLYADDARLSIRHLPLKRALKKRVYDAFDRWAGVTNRTAWQRLTTRTAVLGPRWQRILRAGGIPERQIAITGNPECDTAYRVRYGDSRASESLWADLGLARGAGYLLHCREHYARLALSDEERRQTSAAIVGALRTAAPDLPIVIKMHPRDLPADEEFMRQLDPRLVVTRDLDTFELIHASRLMVTSVSTTQIWSAALDVPTISAFFWKNLEYWRRATEFSGVERVSSPEQLTRAVQRYLSDAAYDRLWQERRDQFVRDTLVFDGQSTQHLVDLLGELIHSRARARA